jgi:hypothetical protein
MQVPTNKGYDYTITSKRPDPPKPNGWLMYKVMSFGLWVFDVTTGFSMAGTTAQSARTRTFFATQLPAAFYRRQRSIPSQAHLETSLSLYVQRISVWTLTLGWRSLPAGRQEQNMKGPHENIAAEGYVKTILAST